jgi:nicotinate dehydrogenase subunit A
LTVAQPPLQQTLLRVNGHSHSLAVDAGAPLLNVLRNDLGLNGPKYGCGLGECGACAVLIDGVAARSCSIPLAGVAGREVTTLEGLGTAGALQLLRADQLHPVRADQLHPVRADQLHPVRADQLHPVQQAFIDTQAAQCGYCLNGMLIATVALLQRHPQPTDAQARTALQHHLCRCGTHIEILAAVQRAAELMAASGRPA